MRRNQKVSKPGINELEFLINNIPDLLLGKNLENLSDAEGLAPFSAGLIQRIFQTHQAEIIECKLQRPSKPDLNVEIRILPEPFELNVEPHLVLLIRDITHRKEAERSIIKARQKAEQSDLLKSAFLANMSHEIRTPLNAIVGFSQIILDEDISREEQEQFYEYISQNSNQLISLVNDIIDLSKLESNQLVIRNSTANLNQIVEEMKVMAENEKKLRSKDHIMIVLDKELPDLDAKIMVDHFRLKQILTNLLVNAIKFTPKGFIQFGYHLKDPETLLFYVRDTGIGIPENKQEEVFQYFHQLDNALNRANTGTGIGLAICKKLIELMKGTIWLQSDPGKGSQFFFTLPYRKV